MSLNLDALRGFLVLSEELHFGKAAKRLYMSQPALTKQLRRLESGLGGPLFERTTGKVALTPAGDALRDRTRLLLADASALESFARQAILGKAGHLRVGAGIATISDLLPRAVLAFRKEYPNISLELQDQGSKQILDAVLSGQLDVGFVRMPVSDPRLDQATVLREEIQIAVPASRFPRPIPLRALKDEPFVLIARSTSETFQTHALSLCLQAGFTAHLVQEAKEIFTLLNLVRAGLGVSLVPSTAKRMKVPGVRFYSLRTTSARWGIAMIWRKDRKASVAPFLKAVQAAAVATRGT